MQLWRTSRENDWENHIFEINIFVVVAKVSYVEMSVLVYHVLI